MFPQLSNHGVEMRNSLFRVPELLLLLKQLNLRIQHPLLKRSHLFFHLFLLLHFRSKLQGKLIMGRFQWLGRRSGRTPFSVSADQAHSTMKVGRARVMNQEQDQSRGRHMFFTKGRVRRKTRRRIQHLHQEGVLTEGPFQKSGHQTQAVCLLEGLAKEKLTQWTKHQTRGRSVYPLCLEEWATQPPQAGTECSTRVIRQWKHCAQNLSPPTQIQKLRIFVMPMARALPFRSRDTHR